MPDQPQFRHVMGHFVTGVTVVTSVTRSGDPCGLTANAVASVSLDPTLVLVCVDRTAATHACILEGGRFAICVLERGDAALAVRFAEGNRRERFEDLSYREEATGSPVLDSALAWLDCTVHTVHDGGDHSIVVGRVQACGAREGEPLVYFRGDFRGMGPS